MTATQNIRIFASSPSDVTKERDALGVAVQDVNSTLAALVPDKGITLELVRWETHTHPDFGDGPQGVIDDQLGHDYDVFVGMMWKRFGTPTPQAGSGTEQEFRAAYAGWEERRRPAHILFYFSEAPISTKLTAAEATQLREVVEFRTELERKGRVGSYRSRQKFGDLVRRDLVLVLSRLLHPGEPPALIGKRTAEGASTSDLAIVRGRVTAAAREYEQIREGMPSGDPRTRRMEVVATQMRTLAQSSFALVPELAASDSPGKHLAAVTALQAIPDPSRLPWLAERVAAEKPFIGYHAMVALLAAARELPDADLRLVDEALTQAEAATRRLRPDADRATVLRHARAELQRRSDVEK